MTESVSAAYWDEAPVLFDVMSADGTILYANATETDLLGFAKGALTGKSMDHVYAAPTVELLKSFFAGAKRGRAMTTQHVQIAMWTKSRQRREMHASLNISNDSRHGLIMRLVKFQVPIEVDRANQLERENDVLSGIIETAQDATYCVEFDEPVDLTAPEHEIIRQVFENSCHWRYCNDAMARLYRLAPGESLNTRDVREVFDRNPENEAFVRTLIACGWHVNDVPSRDHHYDGADVQMHNDVRAHIVDGRLLRFWGVVRDQSGRIMKERHLKAEAGQAVNLLGAVPDPIFVINSEGRIEGGNPAIEWWLGWPLDEILGNRLDAIVKLGVSVRSLAIQAGPGRKSVRRRVTALCSDGSRFDADINIATFDDATGRLVMTLRAVEAPLSRGAAAASFKEARNG